MRLRSACCVLLSSALAMAQEDFASARLEWRRAPGAEDCIADDVLARAVADRLGRDPFVPSGGDIAVRGKVSPLPDQAGWRAELELVTAGGASLGTRTLQTEAEHCSALDESLPLILALMLDVPRDEVRRADERRRAREAPPPAPPPTPLALPRTIHAPREPWRLRAAGVAMGALGLLPGPAFGAGLTVGIEPPSFWLTEIDGSVWLPADAERDGGGARYRLLALGLTVCPVAAGGAALRADFCVGQRVGRLEGDGFGFDRNLDRSRLIYTVGVRGRGWLRIAGPVGLLLGLGAEAPLTRDRFHYVAADGSEPELFRMSPVIGIVELGAGVSLP